MKWLRRHREQDVRAEIEYFDQHLTAEYPYDRGVYAGLTEAEYLEIFGRYFGRSEGKYGLALDIGSGVGLSSLLLGQFVNYVCSMDLSVRGFRKLFGIVKPGEKMPWLLCGNAANAPFGNESFDAIFACGLLHHVPNWRFMLKEISRLLSPGGRLVLIEPNILNIVQTINFCAGRKHGSQSPNEFPMRLAEVVRHCRRYFQIVEADYMRFNHQVRRLASLTKPSFWDWVQILYYRMVPIPLWSQFFAVSCRHRN